MIAPDRLSCNPPLQEVLVQLGRSDPYAYVSCMAVLPEHRRKGAASALLKAAEGLVGMRVWV